MILRCTGVNDVRAAVGFARRTGMPVAVRGRGHCFPGHSATDGVVIDLSRLRGIRVDPVSGTARVQAGVLQGELDAETQAFGLAVPGGIIAGTGVAAQTLGGGIGWLTRRHGLPPTGVRHSPARPVRAGGGNFGVPEPARVRAGSGRSAGVSRSGAVGRRRPARGNLFRLNQNIPPD